MRIVNCIGSKDRVGGAALKASVIKQKSDEPWAFELNPGLESVSQFVRSPDEEVKSSWTFISTAMNQSEWIATFVTFGLYYLITRVLLKRTRKYAVHVTNKAIHIKEEMYEIQFYCMKLLTENQVTYPVVSLAYVCAEDMGPRLWGLIPATVACEVRFSQYPVDSQIPATLYRSNLQIILEPFRTAAKYAFKNAFGVDFDANPVQLVLSLIHAVPLMSTPHMWLVWAGFFGLSLFYQATYAIRDMIFVFVTDPNVGPRQVVGIMDATCFRLEADISEDPTCRESLRAMVRAIANALPNRHIVRPEVKPRPNANNIAYVDAGDKPRDVNNKKRYNDDGGEYAVLGDYLHLSSEEVVYDICAMNPKMSSGDMYRIIMTLGLYYYTDIAGYINHRRNTMFTGHRTITHSVLIENAEVVHSRLEFWVADAFTNMAVVDFRKRSSFRATANSFGWLSFELRLHQQNFMMFLFRSYFRPRFQASMVRRPGLTYMTREDWAANANLKEKCIITASALEATSELLDCAVHSPQKINSFMEYIYGCCCCLPVPQTAITSTNECMYVESFTSSSCTTRDRSFIILPWCDVDGVYWQNFDAEGSFFCCSELNKDSYVDPAYGQKGAQLRICVKGSLSFRMGIALPTQFYGMEQASVNALIDSIIFRSLQNEVVRSRGGKGVLSNEALAVVGMQEITAGSGNVMGMVHQFAGQIRTGFNGNSSDKTATPNVYYNPDGSVVTQPALNPLQQMQAMQLAAPDVNQPVHFSQYSTIPPFRARPRGGGAIGGPGLHFPMEPQHGTQTHKSLVLGEVILRSWRIETSLLDDWQVLYNIISLGLGFFINQICHPFRTFTTVLVTPHRILLQEELFEMHCFCTYRILECETSFKISDLSYLNIIEVGPRWWGLLPGKTLVEMRFGDHPQITENPPNVGEFPSNSAGQNKERNPLILSMAKATEEVYGIAQEVPRNPADVLHRYMMYSIGMQDIVNMITQNVLFVAYFFKHLAIIIGILIWEAILNYIQTQAGNVLVGPKTFQNGKNGRTYWCRFSTHHAPTLAADLVQLLSQLQASKIARLVPSAQLKPKTSGVDFHVINVGQLAEANNTDEYGKPGGFNILQSLWQLQTDEVVYDVLPVNNHIVWTCANIFNTIVTFGYHYFYILRPWTRFKKSYLLTNRRLVRHVLRVSNGSCDEVCVSNGIMYSNLQMWFLSPINSYTVIEEVKENWLSSMTKVCRGCCQCDCCCKSKKVFQFVTDSSRFGAFVFYVSNKSFMKNVLQVVSGGMKQNVLAAIALAKTLPTYRAMSSAQSFKSKKGMKIWTKEDLMSLPEVLTSSKSSGQEFLTTEFINTAENALVINRESSIIIRSSPELEEDVNFAYEVIQAAISATLPPPRKSSRGLSDLFAFCCDAGVREKTILTLTNAAIYLEHISESKMRMLTCIPWPLIDGAYWSNFQMLDPCCRDASRQVPLYGFQGSRLNLHVFGNTHFGVGIQLPERYFAGTIKDEDLESGRVNGAGDPDIFQMIYSLQRNLHRPWLQRHMDFAADPRLRAVLEGNYSMSPSEETEEMPIGSVEGEEKVMEKKAIPQMVASQDKGQVMNR